MNRTIVGLDLSLAGTGIAKCCDGELTWDVVGTQPHSPNKALPDELWTPERHGIIVNRIKTWIDPAPSLVVIEDMFTAKGKSGLDLAQLAGIVRYLLWANRRIPFLLVGNSQVKKFTGTPQAKKGQTVAKGVNTKHVFTRWGHDTDNDNCADAISLAYLGAAVMGYWKSTTTAQGEVISAIEKKNPWLGELRQRNAA